MDPLGQIAPIAHVPAHGIELIRYQRLATFLYIEPIGELRLFIRLQIEFDVLPIPGGRKPEREELR